MTNTEFVSRVRAVFAGSLLVRAIAAAVRLGYREGAAVTRDALAGDRSAPHGSPARLQEFDRFLRLITASRMFVWCARPAQWAAAAWRTSRTAAVAHRIRRELSVFDFVSRCRIAGIALLTAALTDGVLRQFDPRPASAIRVWLWSALFATSILMITAAPGLSAAWSRRFNR